jgi:hypothetical protein
MRGDGQQVDIKPTILNALMGHYVLAYSDVLHELLSPEDAVTYWRLKNLHSTGGGEAIKKQIRQLLMPRNLFPVIHMYKIVDIGGQVFGSRAGGVKNSFVWTYYHVEHTEADWRPTYAQVNFYFEHDFMVPTLQSDGTYKAVKTTHSFASVYSFNHIDPLNMISNGLGVTCPSQFKPKLSDTNPYLHRSPDHTDRIENIKCVQQLAGRWIPAKRINTVTASPSELAEVACLRNIVLQAMSIPYESRQHSV